jgi:hypothetical protein
MLDRLRQPFESHAGKTNSLELGSEQLQALSNSVICGIFSRKVATLCSEEVNDDFILKG